MQKIQFYQSHLDRVSRSFAFCIQKLESPFRQWMSLSYLLCRVLDTVEDSAWESQHLQESQYAEFESFMRELPTAAAVGAWAARFPANIPEGEKVLLNEAFFLFQDLHELSEGPRDAIRGGVETMQVGMQHYSNQIQDGILRLSSLNEVNRYCYFVAGVVGELATRLFVLYRSDFEPSSRFHRNALHFGLFLQKVNLLKDQRVDEREGRHFVPDRARVLSSLRANAIGAIQYLSELPSDEKGYRTFCGWSLFLGAASLPWMEKSYENADATKIPRSVTQELLNAVESIVQDNDELQAAFDEYLHLIPEGVSSPTSAHEEDAEWFRQLVPPSLDRPAMQELGMLT